MTRNHRLRFPMRSPLGSGKGNPRRGPFSAACGPFLLRGEGTNRQTKSHDTTRRRKSEVADPLSSRKKTADHDNHGRVKRGPPSLMTRYPCPRNKCDSVTHVRRQGRDKPLLQHKSSLMPLNAIEVSKQGRDQTVQKEAPETEDRPASGAVAVASACRAPGHEVQAASPFEHLSILDH